MKSSLTDGEICLWAFAKANICSLVVLKVKFNSSFSQSKLPWMIFLCWYIMLCFPCSSRFVSCSKIQYMYVCVKLFQSCPNLCNHMDWSLPGSSVHGILQARVLEWIATFFLTQGSNPRVLHLLHWQAGSLPLVPPGKPKIQYNNPELDYDGFSVDVF